jgi:hypothetical protein
MADTIHTAQYFKIEAPNKPGEFARALGVLRGAGVNLLAFAGFPRGHRDQLDFIPSDPAAFKVAAKQARWKIKGPGTCFMVEGDDRPGAIADLLSPLASAKINVTAIDAASAGGSRYGALFWVKPRDVKRAAKVLGVV